MDELEIADWNDQYGMDDYFDSLGYTVLSNTFTGSTYIVEFKIPTDITEPVFTNKQVTRKIHSTEVVNQGDTNHWTVVYANQ